MSERELRERIKFLEEVIDSVEQQLGIPSESSETTIGTEIERLQQRLAKYERPREVFQPCAFCGHEDDLSRALDSRVCSRCWNDGLRLPSSP